MLAEAEQGDAGRHRGPRRPVLRDARVRHRRAARRARRRPEPDEPLRGDPRRGRSHGIPPAGHAPSRSWSSATTPGYNSDVFARDTAAVVRRRRGARRGAAPPAAHAGAGLRDPPPGRRRRGHGHREPQPAAGQRLQGLPRRRLARSCRRPTPTSRDRSPGVDRRGRRAPRRRRLGDARRRGPRGLPRRRAPRSSPPDTPTRPERRAHRPARRRPRRVASGVRRRRASPRPPPSTSQGAARPRLPDGRFPNPEEPGAIDAALELRRATGRRPRAGQRPGRRPVRRRRARSAGRLADAARRRGRRPARRRTCWPAGVDEGAVFANSIVSSRLLAAIAAAARRPARGDAHRLQVDLAGRGAALRLRGGARLLRGPGVGPRQGRRERGADDGRAGRDPQGARAAASPTSSTTWPSRTASTPTDQFSVRVADLSLIGTVDGAPARAPPGRRRRHRGRARADDLAQGSRQLPPTDGLRYYLEDDSRVIVRPSRHRAQAQGATSRSSSRSGTAGAVGDGARKAAAAARADQGRA